MIHHIFTLNPKTVPQKRLQHPKRHFRKVLREVREFDGEEYMSPDDWYSLWHYHADWSGYGNSSWRNRRRYLEALCIVYLKFTGSIDQIQKPCQLFICLDGSDAGRDAVYIHAPNPHSDFPTAILNASWGILEIESRIGELLPGIRLWAGETGDGSVFIYSPDIGDSVG